MCVFGMVEIEVNAAEGLVIGHHHLTVDKDVSLARPLSIFENVFLAITVTRAATWAVIDLGGSMIQVLSALKLVVAREHCASTTGTSETGRFVVV